MTTRRRRRVLVPQRADRAAAGWNRHECAAIGLRSAGRSPRGYRARSQGDPPRDVRADSSRIGAGPGHPRRANGSGRIDRAKSRSRERCWCSMAAHAPSRFAGERIASIRSAAATMSCRAEGVAARRAGDHRRHEVPVALTGSADRRHRLRGRGPSGPRRGRSSHREAAAAAPPSSAAPAGAA